MPNHNDTRNIPTSRFPLRVALLLCIAIVLVLVAAWPAAAWEPAPVLPAAPGEFEPGELVVGLRPGLKAGMQAALLDRYQAALIRPLLLPDTQLWRVPEGQERATVAKLLADPAVAYAEPNYIYRAFNTPNDPGFVNQWGHTLMQSTQAWDISTGSSGVTIAIIDSGIDETHPDLSAKIVAGYDFVDNDNTPHDLHGHGTHCAGIAAATTNNSVGVAGMNWNARIMPVRVLDASGSGTDANVTDGITWAYQHGAKVLSLSLGGPNYAIAQQTAINNAHAAGSVVVAAMGNDSTNVPSYPAAYDNVLAVAAVGPADVRSSFSNYGSWCDVAAPGGQMAFLHDPNGIYSTLPTYACYLTTNYGYSQNYDYLEGTSQATPYVAGLAALLFGQNPALAPGQVEAIIEVTADDLGTPGRDQYYGYGRINAYAALAINLNNRVYLPFVDKSVAQVVPASLANGNFESGHTAWTEHSSHDWDIIYLDADISLPGFYPHGGSWVAWLGGGDLETAWLQQQVTVPPGQWFLSYYRWIESSDTTCGNDLAYVIVNGDVKSSYSLCTGSSTSDWERLSVNLEPYAGQSISLRFEVATNESGYSSLFVDDVAWVASAVAEPAPRPQGNLANAAWHK